MIRGKWVKSAVSPVTGILEGNWHPKMLQWAFPNPQGSPHCQGLSSLPTPFRYSSSCWLFQGVLPTPSTTQLQKNPYIYKDKLSHSWKILATSRYWGQKEIINPSTAKILPRIQDSQGFKLLTSNGNSLVWRSLKPRTLSQDCLQEKII